MFDTDNPFLNGNYAPWREEGDAFDLEVEGEMPRELNGALYRIGPNPHFKPLGRYHWFDGDGMVHAFMLRDGRAAYRNRYVRTDGLIAQLTTAPGERRARRPRGQKGKRQWLVANRS